MKTLKPTLFFIFSFALTICQAQVIHVPDDYPTIQEGIDAAQFFGDTVLVDEGTYYENIDFSGKFITVASNYILSGDTNDINNTIIDGSQPANPNYGSVVYFHSGEDTNSVICGFTITGGTGIYVPALNIYGGGGIGIENNSGAKIIYNHIEYNAIVGNGGSGGGIGAGDANNTNYVIIKNNRVCNNSVTANENSEGGGIVVFCNAIIKDNIVCNNVVSSESKTAVGGGVRVIGYETERYIECSGNLIAYNEVYSSSQAEYAGAGGLQVFRCYGNVSNNKIIHNVSEGSFGSIGGGSLMAYCTSSLLVENNIIANNYSNYEELDGKGGALYLAVSNPIFINNIIENNFASLGGGIYNHLNLDGPTQLINNTIAFNQEGDEGGAIYLEEADMVVLNSILWDNDNYGGMEIYLDASNIEVAYSDVMGVWPGLGNIDEDPHFEDDSFHLNCFGPSPCIDAGVDEFNFGSVYCYAPDYDFEGEERPLDVTYDIGADESLICTGVKENSDLADNNLIVAPNPSSGTLNIQYTIYSIQYTKVEMYSANGVKVKTLFSGTQDPGDFKMYCDLSDLPNGVYVIRLVAGSKSFTEKIIIYK